MMHGGIAVDKSKHRVSIKKHYKRDMWTFEWNGHTGYLCPTDNNVKNVWYRGYWFRLVVNEFVNFDPQSGRDPFVEFEEAVKEELDRYIKEQGIVFDDEEGSDGNVHSAKAKSETD